MRAVTIDSDLATLFTFTPRKPPITPIQGVLKKVIHGCPRPTVPAGRTVTAANPVVSSI